MKTKKQYVPPLLNSICIVNTNHLMDATGIKSSRDNYNNEEWNQNGDIDAGRNNYKYSIWSYGVNEGVSGGRSDYNSSQW